MPTKLDETPRPIDTLLLGSAQVSSRLSCILQQLIAVFVSRRPRPVRAAEEKEACKGTV